MSFDPPSHMWFSAPCCISVHVSSNFCISSLTPCSSTVMTSNLGLCICDPCKISFLSEASQSQAHHMNLKVKSPGYQIFDSVFTDTEMMFIPHLMNTCWKHMERKFVHLERTGETKSMTSEQFVHSTFANWHKHVE